jgi:hypothetical protein
MLWLQVVAKSSTKPGVRSQETRTEVEQRNVMVARNRQQRRADLVHERTCPAKLVGAGTLGDVAREHQQIRALLARQCQQRRHNWCLLGAEMGVGDLQHYAHG